MKEFLTKVGGFVTKHKIIMIVLGVVIVGAGYFGYQKVKGGEADARYVLTAVEKGTLISSVDASGQIDASSQIDLKPKASGQILSIKVKQGQSVKSGEVIAVIDSTDAQRSVRDAQINLQTAQIAMDKLKEPADQYSIASAESSLKESQLALAKLQEPPTVYDITAAENSIAQAQRSLDKAKDDSAKLNTDTAKNLQNAYDDGYNAVSNAYLKLPGLMNNLYDIQVVDKDKPYLGYTSMLDYYRSVLLNSRSIIIDAFTNGYDVTKALYDKSFIAYKATPRKSDNDTIYKLVDDTLALAKSISTSLENGRNLLDALGDDNNLFQSMIDDFKTEISSSITDINQLIDNLQTTKDNIDNIKDNSPLDIKNAEASVSAAEENLTERKNALAKLKEGPDASDLATAEDKVKNQQLALDKLNASADDLDIKSQQLSVQQRQNALTDAKQTLADYTVKAPFDCIIAKINVNEKDNASSGTSLVTIVSNQMVAHVSMNEVDVAKVKVGNKATLTFDAIDGLTITGQVAEIDTVGTVSQGVVNYNLKIVFDTQDDRIKPGMSVSAAIINQVDQDVLMVESGAIKALGESHYVDILPSNKSNVKTPGAGGEAIDAMAAGSSTSAETTVSSKETPISITVEIGSANDTMTELTGAELKEGDLVVLRTVAASKTAAATSTRSATSLLGGAAPGGGGSFTRITGR